VSNFKERFAKLSPEKQKLLLSQLQKQQQKEASLDRIIPQEKTLGVNSFTLSYPQQQMLAIAQLMPEDTSYSVPLSFNLQGNLNLAALNYSFNQITQRHEILRTTFHIDTGEAIQIIAPEFKIDIPLIDLQHLSSEQQTREVTHQLQQETQSPFNLHQLPLWRVKILKLGTNNHILLFNIHHIVFDGWSVSILIREIKEFYRAYLTKNQPSLSPLPIQYVDYAIWQKKQLQGNLLSSKLEYWQQQLKGLSPLALPTKSSSSWDKTEDTIVPLKLSETLTHQLRQLKLQEGTTTNILLLTAFFILLGRYTNQKDVAVGTVIANRNHQELEALIGCFVNTLVLRANLSENLPFIQLLSRVKNWVLEGYEHREIPFDLLVEKLNPQRTLDRNPLVQIGFAFQNAPTPGFEMGELFIESIGVDSVLSNARFDLEIHLWEGSSNIAGAIVYKPKLFDPEFVSGIADHYERLLESIVADPMQKIDRLSILKEEEKDRVLWTWNQTEKNYPSNYCIHQLFEQQVAQTPEAIAVVFQDRKLTYHQLNDRANWLARTLQELGVGPEILVGLCVDRSLEAIVGLLAILKAGGAYIPLDPTYPQERLSYMLSDAKVSILLTQTALLSKFPEIEAQILCIDREKEKSSSDSIPFTSKLTPENLAYVIYTSGSTGKPKGVMVSHRGLSNLITMQIQAFNVSSNSRILQFASLSFDASIWEIIMALGSGATLYLDTRDHLLPGEDLTQFLRHHCITHITLPPSALAVMPTTPLPNLKTIVVAGEACSPDLIMEWSKGRQFVNAYGPTESTVCATMAECHADTYRPPIGRPISNTTVYLLDKNLQPVPVGLPGELYIGGISLARGYLHRPDLTAEKFIPHPFHYKPGERLYKTGDLARYLPDGNIEFLGRIDYQVKVRGYRIEVGEIEAILNRYSNIKQSLVTTASDASGNEQLVAYVVPRFEENGRLQESRVRNSKSDRVLETDSHLSQSLISELRDNLQQELPLHMIPSVWVFLESFPLTPNGKIDRKSLPKPEIDLNNLGEYVAPRTELEQSIANCFVKVLGVEKVGIHDNFFALGGHSLLATQLISAIHQSLNKKLSLKILFECQTVAELAEALLLVQPEELSRLDSNLSLPIISANPQERYQPFPLTEVQQAYWLGRNAMFELGNVATHGYMEIDCENLDIERLSKAWQHVIDRHDMLRAIILRDGQQKVLEAVPPYEIEVLDLRGYSLQEKEKTLARIRKTRSEEILATDRWPLFKISITRLEEGQDRLHWSLDALIADAWSTIIFSQQWLQLYYAPQTKLPQLDITFRDYVMAELRLQENPEYQRSQQYWFNRLESLPPAPELPLVQQPATLKQPQFKSYTKKLLPREWEQLKARSKAAHLTVSGVLLAAFADLLGYWSKSSAFTINLTLFNRWTLHPQVNQLVGDFTSLTLLEVNQADAVPFRERAQRIQKQLWQDLDHRYVSGVEVQRALRRYRGHTSSMGVVFTSTLALDSMADRNLDNQGALPLNPLGELVYMVNKTPQVWLDHSVVEHEGGLMLIWNAVEELFPVHFLEEMFESYYDWLCQLAMADEAWDLICPQLLPRDQLTQRLESNKTMADVSEETLHGLFVQQVERQGSSIAVITPGKMLTYNQLYVQASKISRKLQQLGAIPNTLVAVCLEKGAEQVAAVLGILMSGAAYVPIDPALPQERKKYLLEQTKVRWVLTQSDLGQQLVFARDLVEFLFVDLVEDLEVIEISDFRPLQSSTDLAYVIFTSGSTGTPKGVMIDHRGAVNTLLDLNQRFQLQSKDRVLALSALNFDLSVYDIFGFLAAGGAIVMPEPEGAKDPAHWVELMRVHNVTFWNTVPALMQMLVEYLSQHPPSWSSSLRLIFLSGDWIPLYLPLQIQGFWPQAQLIALGGATEASIWSVYYPITTIDPKWKSIPYGKPLMNQSLYVLNQKMQLCPNWVAGQLYIGGMGLAQGYWGDRQKTEASFIINPDTRERLYKTGDLARYLPDGNLEFLGREDFQVKINGYRIELGEIEVALQKDSRLKESVAAAVEEGQHKHLVAYVVLHSGMTSTTEELRKHLQQYLPDYMIPSHYIFLETLPLTENGKLDRKHLPIPELKDDFKEKDYVAPRNSQELELVKIWEDILEVQPVGVRSNFFDLGGHSLLAVRLMNRIEQRWGWLLPLSTLFVSSTIEELALVLNLEQKGSLPSALVPIQPQGSQPPIFCVHPAGGTVFCYLRLAQLLGTDQPFYGLQSLGQVEGQEPLSSVEEMAKVYQAEIQKIQPHGPYFLMGWSFGGLVALQMSHNWVIEGEEVAFLALMDTYSPSEMPDEKQLSEAIEIGLELFGGNLSLAWEEIRKLPSEEQVSTIWQEAQQAHLIPPDFPRDRLEHLLTLMNLNHQAIRSYSPPPYTGEITLLRAALGSLALAPEAMLHVQETLGWEKVVTGSIEVHTIPGYHEQMVHPPQVAIVANTLNSCLQKVLH